MRLAERTMADPWTYSTSSRKALVCVESCQLTSAGISAVLATPSGNIRIRSPLLGRLNLYNVLAAAAAALALGVPTDFICAGLESLEFVDGRLQNVAIPSEAGFQVVVDYAHTPDAMEKSLKCLKEMTIGRLLVVFGCGGDRDRGKRSLMGEVAARFGDIVILTSDNPRSEAPGSIIEDIEPGVRRDGFPFLAPDNTLQPESGYTIEIDRRRAIQIALSWAQPGDMVFIGGKGHETYQIIGDTVLPFDDRVAVRDYFQSAVSASHKKVRGE